MSLRDGSAKMSKSDPSDMSRINLVDDADTIMKKVKKAKTDPDPLPETMEELEPRPEALNLVTIFAALTDRAPQDVLAEHAGKGFGAFATRAFSHVGRGGSRVVALSGGLGKLEATRAALRAGLITDLIVDESLGRALVSAKGAQQARSA